METANGHFRPAGTCRWVIFAVWVAALLMLPACGRSFGGPSTVAEDSAQTTQAEQASEQSSAAIAPEDFWEALYLQGAKIGYAHTTIEPTVAEGRQLVRTDALNHLSLTRFGQTTEQDLTVSSLETPDGDLVEFKSVIQFGTAPTVITGRVAGDKLLLTVQTQGRQQQNQIPWQAGTRSFRGVEQSLAAKPIKPGETRQFKMLIPIVNQIADVGLRADKIETTSVLGVEAKLLRVESSAKLPGGQSMDTTLWVDDRGEVIKSRMAALQQESFRTTPEIAKTPGDEIGQLDLGLDLLVKVEPPLKNPLETQEVVYKVELTEGDPAKVFASGSTQTVKSLGPHTAEITVRSLRPAELTPDEGSTSPGEEFTKANSILQLDDPRLKQMAAEAKGDATKPHEIAAALEKYVSDAVTEKNFSQGFASAAEVAETRTGDCTEHAVLLAALARICGLPSRVAMGLVYVSRAEGFGYHMWTEVFLNGQWVPLDGVVGAGGTSAAYLKLNDSSLEGASAYSSFLPVAQVLGQLKVSVVSVK